MRRRSTPSLLLALGSPTTVLLPTDYGTVCFGGFCQANANGALLDPLSDDGLGILIGDGKLPHYGPENVIETYYNCEPFKGINIKLDYQLTADPTYNKDRARSIFSLRGRGLSFWTS